jgi:hypothetical protein
MRMTVFIGQKTMTSSSRWYRAPVLIHAASALDFASDPDPQGPSRSSAARSSSERPRTTSPSLGSLFLLSCGGRNTRRPLVVGGDQNVAALAISLPFTHSQSTPSGASGSSEGDLKPEVAGEIAMLGPTPAFVDEADHGRDHFEEARRLPPEDTTSSWQGFGVGIEQREKCPLERVSFGLLVRNQERQIRSVHTGRCSARTRALSVGRFGMARGASSSSIMCSGPRRSSISRILDGITGGACCSSSLFEVLVGDSIALEDWQVRSHTLQSQGTRGYCRRLRVCSVASVLPLSRPDADTSHLDLDRAAPNIECQTCRRDDGASAPGTIVLPKAQTCVRQSEGSVLVSDGSSEVAPALRSLVRQ